MILSVNTIIKRKNATEGGRIGGFFRFADSNRLYGISCNHVIANFNHCNVGDLLTDENDNPVGTLSHWLILDSTMTPNKAEFALFRPPAGCDVAWKQDDAGFKPSGFATPLKNDTARFVCADWSRQGTITDAKHRVNFPWNGPDYLFDCVEITAMAGQQFSVPNHSGGVVYVGDKLLGIILGVGGAGDTKTYVVPFVGGILSVVGLQVN